ncbi:tRNA (N6-threonylcarbamoyladenosine(37)-N6)-methyltransferase TrmO [Aliidiomarina soli]|uniref:tRNA (N6-threonylcarbamoyladenosine(37)-N6)-methyltransferase TrmO n=1 Tax=Aliidiomarina soli TaxID=1928574 RepID=A0A432WLL4_9GAMM|nr:tRNA (N6-threonylcarbamoyladenosine(37)-N6)-methyltransferase TrmO [Aliidiomarina soli]RUO34621.1 tRNA (N6-threonylcarbamoyladenosine(37)-N6)-methyltransferase TrmO [Aliidiomarina soli]
MYTLEPIAIVESPYKEKFAIPRQPGLVPSAEGRVVLQGAFNNPQCLQGLEQFSHLWLQFIFHQTQAQGWKPLVRPPRLGGNSKVGVFASRSTFRPNALGLSVVRLQRVECRNGQWQLVISGFDLLDQTPIVDIKPYLHYSDAVHDSQSGFAQLPPELMPVTFAPEVEDFFARQPNFAQLVREVLAQDPRPAYRHGQSDNRTYGVRLSDYNINWIVRNEVAVVTAVSDC